MHEASIADALLQQVRTLVPAHATLRTVQLDVGELEHIEPTLLQAAWDGMTADTPLAGSVLHIDRQPMHVKCRSCEQTYTPDDIAILLCPHCGATRPHILSGSGIVLRSLEVDQPVSPSES
jgi:hydrogenase nickel incorporation protein HypA/HybF